jgi:small multidrug resistance pump
MIWVIFFIGVITEVAGTICMKEADGFKKLTPSVLVFLFYGLSLVCLVFVFEVMNIAIVYAIWSSLGILLVVLIGIIRFRERLTWARAISITLIVLGIIGLEAL